MSSWGKLTAGVEEWTYDSEGVIVSPTVMLINNSVDYITGDRLIPHLNTVINRQAYLINSYGLLLRGEQLPFAEIADMPARYKKFAETMSIDALGDAVDDVVVYGETDDSLWMFWMHRSDRCEVLKLGKLSVPGTTLQEFIDAHIQHLKKNFDEGWDYNGEHPTAIITRIPGEMTTVSWV